MIPEKPAAYIGPYFFAVSGSLASDKGAYISGTYTDSRKQVTLKNPIGDCMIYPITTNYHAKPGEAAIQAFQKLLEACRLFPCFLSNRRARCRERTHPGAHKQRLFLNLSKGPRRQNQIGILQRRNADTRNVLSLFRQ